MDTGKYLKTLVIMTCVASALLFGLLAFWQFYPYKVVETYPKPYKIVYPVDKTVRQGGYITYQFKYNKYTDKTAQLNRQFVDGLVFNVEGQQQPTIFGVGSGIARAQIHVPETLPPGRYKLRIIATYELNPIRDFVNESETEFFTVMPGSHVDRDFDEAK